MKSDCIKLEDCLLPFRLCNDDCPDYEPKQINPLEEEADRGCEEYHTKKDMGEI